MLQTEYVIAGHSLSEDLPPAATTGTEELPGLKQDHNSPTLPSHVAQLTFVTAVTRGSRSTRRRGGEGATGSQLHLDRAILRAKTDQGHFSCVQDQILLPFDDNPTVGDHSLYTNDASFVRYSVLHGNEQIFASRYKLVLPSQDELRAEVERERDELEGSSEG